MTLQENVSLDEDHADDESVETGREKLEASTEERLRKFNLEYDGGDPGEPVDDDPGEPVDDDPGEPENKSVDPVDDDPGEPADDDSGEPENKSADPVDGEGEEAAGDEPPTLPAAYRRSLKSKGWTDDEIDGHYRRSPDAFLQIAARLHQDRVAEISRFADLGRKIKAEVGKKSDSPQKESEGKSPASPFSHMELIDPEDLVEEFGNSEVISKLIEPINAVIGRLNDVMPAVESGMRAAEKSEREALVRQIDGFFGSSEMSGYAEFYGTDSPTEEQVATRNKVLELADALLTGNQAQHGQNPAVELISVEEALRAGHDVVAGEFNMQAARKEVRASAKKRASGVSLRPTHTGKNGKSSSDTRHELEQRVSDGLKRLFQ